MRSSAYGFCAILWRLPFLSGNRTSICLFENRVLLTGLAHNFAFGYWNQQYDRQNRDDVICNIVDWVAGSNIKSLCYFQSIDLGTQTVLLELMLFLVYWIEKQTAVLELRLHSV